LPCPEQKAQYSMQFIGVFFQCLNKFVGIVRIL